MKEIESNILKKCLKEISRLPNAVERDHYLRQLSTEFSLSLDALEQQQRKYFFNERKKGTLPQVQQFKRH